jgi:drug/metabolite transporter (DMT)-like permease
VTASKSSPFEKNAWPDPLRVETSNGRAPSRSVLTASIGFLVVVWALNFVAGKIALRHFPAVTLASFRVVLAGVLMFLGYLACRHLPAFVDRFAVTRVEQAARARQQRHSWRDLWTFLYLGFFGVAVNQVCFTVGLRYTSVSHSAVIVGMGPIYTLVLAVLFRLEKATWRKATGMALALIGIVIMASENGLSTHSPSLLGDAITMTGSIGFAIYAVLGKRVAARYDSLTMTAYNFLAGALILLPVAIRQARAIGPSKNWHAIPWEAWAALLFMAVFSSALAYLFYFWLLRFLEASQLSAFTYLLPVCATILGILWLGERGSWGQVLGGGLALGGVYWIEAGRGR